MKFREGFVSNSSSTSFIITNKTDKTLTVRDFAEENIHLLGEFLKEYDWHEYTKEEFLSSADDDKRLIEPGENSMSFGDEAGTIIESVYDYQLRNGGESARFKWRFHHYLR